MNPMHKSQPTARSLSPKFHPDIYFGGLPSIKQVKATCSTTFDIIGLIGPPKLKISILRATSITQNFAEQKNDCDFPSVLCCFLFSLLSFLQIRMVMTLNPSLDFNNNMITTAHSEKVHCSVPMT